MNIITVFIAVSTLLIVWVVLKYNRFVALINRAKEAWSDIEVQMKRRYDLIPNLVNTVKGYATHEREAFEKVIAARSAAMGAHTVGEHGRAEGELAGALKTLFALSEAYPDLKANQNFLELQRELSDTENKIQAARRFYNANVRDLNTGLQSFPGNVVAAFFNFKEQEFFDLPEGSPAQEPVEVKF